MKNKQFAFVYSDQQFSNQQKFSCKNTRQFYLFSELKELYIGDDLTENTFEFELIKFLINLKKIVFENSSLSSFIINFNLQALKYMDLKEIHIDRININDNPVGINETNNLQQISIFPNPANGEINVSVINSDNYQLNLFNVLGEKVYSGRFTANTKISTGQFSKGIYIVEINCKNYKINKRLVIN
jgi:hypothetical protein